MANRREKNDDVADPAIGSFPVLWIIGEGEKGGAAVHQHRRRTQQRRTHFWKQRTKMSCVSASAATCRVAPAVRGQRFNKRVATVAPRAHNRRALAIQAAVDLNGARPDARLCSFWIPIGRGIGLRDRRAPAVAAPGPAVARPRAKQLAQASLNRGPACHGAREPHGPGTGVCT